VSFPTIFDCEHCGKTVCNVCYCTGYPEHPLQPTQVRIAVHDVIFHELWDELHTKVETAEQFADWVTRVPQWGCGCQSWLRDYVRDNPPTDDMREYGWRLHNAVNAKLSKPFFIWPDFEKMYPNDG